jgi:hypothetical protein
LADEIWRDSVLDMPFDVWLEAPPIGPCGHISAVTEVCGEMIASLRPGGEDGRTETAARLDGISRALPGLHVWLKLAAMHKLEVLSQVVLAVKCAFLECLLLASEKVVRLKVFGSGIGFLTEDAVLTACKRHSESAAFGTACPPLKGEVQ